MSGMNQIKTVALLGLLSGVLVLGSDYLVGNEHDLYMGLVLGALTSLGSWYCSDIMAIAAHQAHPITRQESPQLYDLVASLSQRADIPMPAVFLIPTQSPNAFATGRDPNHAAVAVTEGIMQLLSQEELAGVLAHELTHIRNRDTLTQAVAGTLAGTITFLGRMLSLGALYGPVTHDDRHGGNPLEILFLIVLAPLAAA
jgi:heat shock protein HtpX